jgi:hypothetical protein
MTSLEALQWALAPFISCPDSEFVPRIGAGRVPHVGRSAMKVHIIEIKTGKVAAAIAIDPAQQSRIPSEPEFFATAWQCAVEDSSVDPGRRDDYSFRLMR